ncbi:phosphotransferase [Glycomyces luteolus]|uniref:Phosphotransferase n=1 Tax=Glycomyces luteolus TaxID=2670330 RepID=A0A9X3SSY9_9ACTN|nr:phosphotransferase [Glycomyces luteolus]MDA1359683.1 phosphotransferase [Glycomyces luteolus]
MPESIEALRARYSGYTWAPIGIGHSEAQVWRLEGPSPLFAKVGNDLAREAEALRWLASFDLGAPELVAAGRFGDGRDYLVTTAVPGRSGAEPWPESDRGAVVEAIGRYLGRFHTLPVDECPFRDEGATGDDLVVSHGDFMLPNVILDPRTLTVNGVVDVGTLGVAERGRDIHDMVWSLTAGLNPQYGEAHADRFRKAAGR